MWAMFKNFTTSFIMLFLTLFLFVNLIYAFDLFDSIGLNVFGNSRANVDFQYYYFGVSDLLKGWEIYFENNTFIRAEQSVLSFFNDNMKLLDINTYVRNIDMSLVAEGFARAGYSWLSDILYVLNTVVSIFNTFFNLIYNVAYIFYQLAYFVVYFFYVITLIFNFILFFFSMLCGERVSKLPNTYGEHNYEPYDPIVPTNVLSFIKMKLCLLC